MKTNYGDLHRNWAVSFSEWLVMNDFNSSDKNFDKMDA